jgi:MscS family membrane protein
MTPPAEPFVRAAARCAPLLLAVLALCALLGAHAAPVHAQVRAAEPAAVPRAQAGPADPWQRGTPRSALRTFLEAARDGRYEDAAHVLDLAALGQEERARRGPALARELKFLLDEGLWVDLAAVSDDPAGALDDGLSPERDLVGELAQDAGGLALVMERKPREDGVLVWFVASSTLARVPAAYAEHGPPAIVDDLPRVLRDTRFLEVALWQWLGLILLVVAAWAFAWAISSTVVRVLKPLTLRSETDVDDRLLAVVVGPVRLLVTIGAFNAGLHVLRLSVPANDLARDTSKFLVIAGIAWLVMRVIDLFGTIGRERFLAQGQTGAAHLVPLGARAVKVAVVLMTVLATLDTFGFDVTAIIAGLGVGGLAVALAAQKTVENVFGGVSVLVDQPVRPGDFCKFGDKHGTVEDIGLRSTRIRTLDRTVVSVPNSEFSNLQIENFAPRDRVRLLVTLGLRYETTPDQLRHVMAELRKLLLAHPKVLSDPARVRFVGFGASSLDVEIFAYVDTASFDEFLAVREDLYLRFLDVVAASGTTSRKRR